MHTNAHTCTHTRACTHIYMHKYKYQNKPLNSQIAHPYMHNQTGKQDSYLAHCPRSCFSDSHFILILPVFGSGFFHLNHTCEIYS